MKRRLINVDSKMPNLALMKISAHHGGLRFYDPLFDAHNTDKVYASKVFKFTPDYQYFPDCEIKRGGSGYDLETVLPNEIEHIYPDYFLYNCDYAIGFTSRGCPRKCPFCIVPEKEGQPRSTNDIYEFWNGQKRLVLLDNNLTALPEHFKLIVGQLIKEKIKVDFSQGLDIRLITPKMARLLSKVKTFKQIHFAFDDIKSEKAVRRGIDILVNNGVSKNRLMLYVLIGFNSTPDEDLYRVQLLRELGVDPFVMPFDKHNRYQKDFARWVNHKAIFKTVKWKSYARTGGDVIDAIDSEKHNLI